MKNTRRRITGILITLSSICMAFSMPKCGEDESARMEYACMNATSHVCVDSKGTVSNYASALDSLAYDCSTFHNKTGGTPFSGGPGTCAAWFAQLPENTVRYCDLPANFMGRLGLTEVTTYGAGGWSSATATSDCQAVGGYAH